MSSLAFHFKTLEQQRKAATLGMWIFLATEVMFFGGLFVSYTVYRFLYPETWHEASRHLDLLLGGVNTAILLTSSFTMALGVWAIRENRRGMTSLMLALTAALGIAFLCIKGYEYHHKYTEQLVPGEGFHYEGANANHAEIFFWLYFTMTGLHALHVIIGIGIIVTMGLGVWRRRITRENFMPMEITGLYWHFVDIVWVFLFPLLYLAGTRG